VSTYNLVLSVALRTSLYGALKELMSPAVLMIIIVMYDRCEGRAFLFNRTLYVDIRCTSDGVRTFSCLNFSLYNLKCCQLSFVASCIDTYVEVGLQRNVRSTSLYVLYLGVLRVERRTVRRDRRYVATDRGDRRLRT
jgi:hypothetical protein